MSTRGPSIKGSALASLVDDIHAARDHGHLSSEALEARLEPVDLGILETKVQAALWYPTESYRRFSELLLELEGHGDPEYLVRRGARAARRLWESGLYVQFAHGEEQLRAKGALSDHDSRLITTLSGAIFNFSQWSFRRTETGGEIQVCEAREMPEVCVYATRGFLEYVIGRLGRDEIRVEVERPAPDRVTFRYALRR